MTKLRNVYLRRQFLVHWHRCTSRKVHRPWLSYFWTNLGRWSSSAMNIKEVTCRLGHIHERNFSRGGRHTCLSSLEGKISCSEYPSSEPLRRLGIRILCKRTQQRKNPLGHFWWNITSDFLGWNLLPIRQIKWKREFCSNEWNVPECVWYLPLILVLAITMWAWVMRWRKLIANVKLSASSRFLVAQPDLWNGKV